jgi:hypothetical protein
MMKTYDEGFAFSTHIKHGNMHGFHWNLKNNAIVGWFWDNPTDLTRETDQMLQEDHVQYIKDEDEYYKLNRAHDGLIQFVNLYREHIKQKKLKCITDLGILPEDVVKYVIADYL